MTQKRKMSPMNDDEGKEWMDIWLIIGVLTLFHLISGFLTLNDDQIVIGMLAFVLFVCLMPLGMFFTIYHLVNSFETVE